MAESIKLLIGPYKSGKTKRLLAELVAFKKSHPLSPCTVVVPSARHRLITQRHIGAMLEEHALKIAFNLQIEAFYPFCESVLKASQIRYRALPEDLRALVLGTVLSQMRATDRLQHLSKLVGFPGTSSALLKLIDEFQRAGYTPNDVLSRLSASSAEQSRYVELATIYDAYWRELDRLQVIDQKRIAFEAREALFARRLDNFHKGMILVDGFDRISPLQADIIAGLPRYAEQVWMTFDYVETTAEAHGGPTYEWNASSFANLELHMNPQIIRHGMETAKAVSTTGEHIEVFRALDRFAEMQEIAARCKEAIHKDKVRPSRLLVVARQIDKYRGAVEAAFQQSGVPYYLDLSIAYEELPFIQFVLDLLSLPLTGDAGQGDFPRAKTISCLRSKFLNTQSLEMTPADVDYLDAKSLERAIVGGKEQWQKVLSAGRSDVRAGMEKFFAHLNALNTPATCTQHVGALEDLLDKLLTLPSGKTTDARSKLVQQSRQGEKALRRCLQILIEEEQLFDLPSLSFKEFLSKLEPLLSRGSFTARGTGEAVLITSADTAPNRGFSHVFIAGLVEGEFPRRGGQAGFAGQDELARWSTFNIDLKNPRGEPGFEAALYRSLYARSDRVTLSFPQFEMGGDEKIPSFFVAEAQGVAEANVPLTEPMARALQKPVSARDAIGGWLWHQNRRLDMQLPPELANQPAIDGLWESLSDAVTAGVSRLFGNPQNTYNGYLVPLVESQALTIAAKDSWSATQLNNYGQCPFKYWLSGVLQLQPRVEGGTALSAKLQGLAYHKVLEDYYRQLNEKNIDHRAGVRDDIFELALASGLTWLAHQQDFNPGPYWSNEKEDMRLRLKRFLQWESQVRKNIGQPARFEVKFGRRGPDSLPPLVLKTDSGNIKISGAIDRIDLASSAAHTPGETAPGQTTPEVHLVDYKSGSSPMKPDDAVRGTNIQLPLYALAVEASIIPGSRVASASYLSVRQAKVAGNFQFKTEAHMEIPNITRRHVENFVRDASRGDFHVQPATFDVCKTCDHKQVCRISELRHAQVSAEETLSYD